MILSDFHSVSVSETSQSVEMDIVADKVADMVADMVAEKKITLTSTRGIE